MKHTSFPRVWLSAAAVVACGCWLAQSAPAAAGATYTPPASPRITYNFNPDWKFLRQDAPGAQEVSFDDSTWQTVSTPHSFNDVDSFNVIIDHSGGDRGKFQGLTWYRKHFKLPAAAAGSKVFIEFEGMRQAGKIYFNGKSVGLYENGITGYGLDISDAALFGDQDNVLAVQVDNRTSYREQATQTPFRWNANDFNPVHGGINRRVWLHLTGKIYQTLPLFYGLGTTGAYIYGGNYNIAGRTCDVTVESQVHNETGAGATATLSCAVVDKDGVVRATFQGNGVEMPPDATNILTATGQLANARFWSVDDPNLYDVYTILTVGGKVVDVNKVRTGFRKTEFLGGSGTGGVYIKDNFVYLKGFAQRSSDEWAGVGAGYPDWMHDFSAQMLRDCNGNYMRWMHVTPQKVDVEAYDRFGIVEVAPAGDKEEDAQGVQWNQRLAVMRDSMIYLRNNPSVLFWEAGNTGVTAPQMKQMVDMRAELDPHGGRTMGCRSLRDPGSVEETEWYGTMLGGPFNAAMRDKAPMIETEDFRDEGARRFWDDFSPPHFGFKQGPRDTWNYNSESFAVAQVGRYWSFFSSCITNTDPNRAKWSAYASIYFNDSDADGRQDSSEVCRVSGKIDAMRLPKEIYFAERVMQNEYPDIHIIGHWTYPADTTKTMYVVANNVDEVELLVNGVSHGRMTQPKSADLPQPGQRGGGGRGRIAQTGSGYLYVFTNITFAPGVIKAVGYKGGAVVTQHELKTAGAPAAIKLTLHTGPNGLQADGEDVALIDFEVVDAAGERCPTDEARVDFKVTGPAIWRGGYNSGMTNTVNNLYLSTECGINRVAVRATRSAGTITVTAQREGLKPATVTMDAKPVAIQDGLTLAMPQTLTPAPRAMR
ncbi:MAG: sugar-binding domain-containing protein [Verrucomicrobiota bacterium]